MSSKLCYFCVNFIYCIPISTCSETNPRNRPAMSMYETGMSHKYRSDRRAIHRIPSRNAVASTTAGYIAFSIAAFAFMLLLVTLVIILDMTFLPDPKIPSADWDSLGSMCKIFPHAVFVLCLIFRLELWCATKDAIADAEFMDEIFEELYQDAENLLEIATAWR